MAIFSRITIGFVFYAFLTHFVTAVIFYNNKLVPPKRSTVGLVDVQVKTGYFKQLLDHANPSLGTFRQRYYWSDKYYKGPGSPVVLWTPGEEDLDGYQGYISNMTITGQFAQAIGGAVVLLEHRYWGESSPVKVLNAETMQHLTLKNAIADLVNFANNAELPFDKNGASKPTKAPWVLSGGSYSGALAGWTESTANGTFWAYHASSAVVETIYDFWEYFLPIELNMGKECVENINLALDQVNHMFKYGTKSEIIKLKDLFGLPGVKHATDFGAAIAAPTFWQFYSIPGFCPALKKGHGVAKSRREKAFTGYAHFYKNNFSQKPCPKRHKHDLKTKDWCLNSYYRNSSVYTDTSLNNDWDRQWVWLLCNEPFGWWQVSAPPVRRTLVSRLVQAEYYQRTCSYYFPTVNGYTFGSNKGKKESQVNAYTQGWIRKPATRLMWANHQYDPWRSATVSAEMRPGGPQQSTPNEQVRITPGGYHCQDLIVPPKNDHSKLAKASRKIINEEVAQMKIWVSEYPGYSKL